MSERHILDQPEKVTVDTVGPPGQRVFYLQAKEGWTLVTLKVEKQQVAALAEHLGELLKDLSRPGHLPEGAELGLDEFVEESFIVGVLGIAYDAATDRLVMIAGERVGEDEEGDEARIAMSREQAGALAIRGTQLVESGRPPCPLCGFPLDPRGHACPRTNGHSAPQT